eukprot:gene653-369_t
MTCVTGDETGLVKVWDISRSSGSTLRFSYGEQKRERCVMGLCWVDINAATIAMSTKDGVLSILNTSDQKIIQSMNVGFCAGLSSSIAYMKEKMVIVDAVGGVQILDDQLNCCCSIAGTGSVDASHMHRKYGMIALGGKDNNLKVYDVGGERVGTPVFEAQSPRDHVLDVPYPIFITGACIINPFVSCVCTAYHEVRFYDRRASTRAVQEFEISREIERRPTKMLQWNCNKFLIGEASGDVHLYDTRRGFTSRAKLRGGTGSVRGMAKHPAGHQILGVTGLDRKARLYHVPTGKLLMTLYTKQRCNCVLLDKQMPLVDDISSFSGITNKKKPLNSSSVSSDIWDDMDPVVDEFEDETISSYPLPGVIFKKICYQASINQKLHPFEIMKRNYDARRFITEHPAHPLSSKVLFELPLQDQSELILSLIENAAYCESWEAYFDFLESSGATLTSDIAYEAVRSVGPDPMSASLWIRAASTCEQETDTRTIYQLGLSVPLFDWNVLYSSYLEFEKLHDQAPVKPIMNPYPTVAEEHWPCRYTLVESEEQGNDIYQEWQVLLQHMSESLSNGFIVKDMQCSRLDLAFRQMCIQLPQMDVCYYQYALFQITTLKDTQSALNTIQMGLAKAGCSFALLNLQVVLQEGGHEVKTDDGTFLWLSSMRISSEKIQEAGPSKEMVRGLRKTGKTAASQGVGDWKVYSQWYAAEHLAVKDTRMASEVLEKGSICCSKNTLDSIMLKSEAVSFHLVQCNETETRGFAEQLVEVSRQSKEHGTLLEAWNTLGKTEDLLGSSVETRRFGVYSPCSAYAAQWLALSRDFQSSCNHDYHTMYDEMTPASKKAISFRKLARECVEVEPDHVCWDLFVPEDSSPVPDAANPDEVVGPRSNQHNRGRLMYHIQVDDPTSSRAKKQQRLMVSRKSQLTVTERHSPMWRLIQKLQRVVLTPEQLRRERSVGIEFGHSFLTFWCDCCNESSMAKELGSYHILACSRCFRMAKGYEHFFLLITHNEDKKNCGGDGTYIWLLHIIAFSLWLFFHNLDSGIGPTGTMSNIESELKGDAFRVLGKNPFEGITFKTRLRQLLQTHQGRDKLFKVAQYVLRIKLCCNDVEFNINYVPGAQEDFSRLEKNLMTIMNSRKLFRVGRFVAEFVRMRVTLIKATELVYVPMQDGKWLAFFIQCQMVMDIVARLLMCVKSFCEDVAFLMQKGFFHNSVAGALMSISYRCGLPVLCIDLCLNTLRLIQGIVDASVGDPGDVSVVPKDSFSLLSKYDRVDKLRRKIEAAGNEAQGAKSSSSEQVDENEVIVSSYAQLLWTDFELHWIFVTEMKILLDMFVAIANFRQTLLHLSRVDLRTVKREIALVSYCLSKFQPRLNRKHHILTMNNERYFSKALGTPCVDSVIMLSEHASIFIPVSRSILSRSSLLLLLLLLNDIKHSKKLDQKVKRQDGSMVDHFFCLGIAFLGRWKYVSTSQHPPVRGDVLLVFAHPDDEAMFSPILLYLKQQKISCHFLCLSNGNFNAQGPVREQEVYASAAFFGIPKRNVKVVNHSELQDGMSEKWPETRVMREIEQYLEKAMHISTVITFDADGVSSHPNHMAVHAGVKKLRNNMPPGIIFLQLKTRSLLMKYISFASLFIPVAFPSVGERKRFNVVIPPGSIFTSFAAMKRHASQLVWFRYLQKSGREDMAPKPFQPPGNWAELFTRLEKYRKTFRAPVDTIGCHCLHDPNAPRSIQRFQTLIALMLSSQTKDEVTAEAMNSLIRVGLTPPSIRSMRPEKLNRLISKVGFHNNKTKYIKSVVEILLDKYDGAPPVTYEELVLLPGVGPKMAHLFLQAADQHVVGIGVDTHVHRIARRFRWVPATTKTPEDTRKVLESWLPKKHWGTINELIVGLGQTVCSPVNPRCCECNLQDVCPNAFSEGSGTRSKPGVKRLVHEDIEDSITPPKKKPKTTRLSVKRNIQKVKKT